MRNHTGVFIERTDVIYDDTSVFIECTGAIFDHTCVLTEGTCAIRHHTCVIAPQPRTNQRFPSWVRRIPYAPADSRLRNIVPTVDVKF